MLGRTLCARVSRGKPSTLWSLDPVLLLGTLARQALPLQRLEIVYGLCNYLNDDNCTRLLQPLLMLYLYANASSATVWAYSLPGCEKHVLQQHAAIFVTYMELWHQSLMP